ncbi:MAG: alpha/beta fold hydrolase [Pseudomonadales bacterium]|nr:alpha/beta fold hydrolase [Pseudomonadales bacterium]
MLESIDLDLNVIRSGESNSEIGKPPVVLLHGLFGMGRNLGTISRALSDQFAVFSFDLPNHGRSPHVDEMTITSMADHVVAMFDRLELDAVNLLGHSLGGKVAMSIALRYPQRVNKLIVADIAPVTYPAKHDEILETLGDIDVQQAVSRAAVQQLIEASIDDKAVSLFLMQNLEKHDEGFRWRMNLPAIIQNYAELRQGLSLDGDHHAFESPVLFIGGERSNYIQAKYEAVSRVLFPNSSFKEIAGAGHWLHAEKPDEFNDLVLCFFE